MKKLLFILIVCSNAVFAQKAVKSGIVYKEHPYIQIIKQVAALYEKGDTNAMAKFYADTARAYGMTRYQPADLAKGRFAPGECKSLAQAKAGWKDVVDNWEQIKMTPVMEPVAIKPGNEPFSVQSWWQLTLVNKKTKKTAIIEMVLVDFFNKEGKITSQLECYDPTPVIAAMK
jgi:hypothetical protein